MTTTREKMTERLRASTWKARLFFDNIQWCVWRMLSKTMGFLWVPKRLGRWYGSYYKYHWCPALDTRMDGRSFWRSNKVSDWTTAATLKIMGWLICILWDTYQSDSMGSVPSFSLEIHLSVFSYMFGDYLSLCFVIFWFRTDAQTNGLPEAQLQKEKKS